MSATAQAIGTPQARSRSQLWRDIWQLVREFWSAHPAAMLGSIAVLLFGNARTGVYLLAMGGLVDALSGTASGGVFGERSALFWVWVYIGASAVEQVYWLAKSLSGSYLRDHAVFRIQKRVLLRASAAPLIQYEEGEFFDHLQRASGGMGDRLAGLTMGLMDFLQLAFMLLSVSAAMYLVHPLLLPLLILGTLPSVWLHMRVASVIYQVQREHTTRDRIRTHLQGLLTGREAASEVRLFGTAGYLLRHWQALRAGRGHDMLVAEKRRALSTMIGSLCAGAAYALALALVAFLILRSQLSVGSYVAVATGALWFQDMLGGFIRVFRSMEEQSQFLGDLFDFARVARVEGSGDPAPGAGAVPHSRATAARGMAVAAENLAFAYPGRPGPVLDRVSLAIAPGERIAIVGENGAGKTTLAKLLVGLYQPDEGAIRLDGEPLTEGRAQEARRRIAAVFQDYAAFQLSVRENIGFGNVAALQDDHALGAAAERAGIGTLLDGLPEGADTYLGRQFGDRELSGGQWQRIALARAFFRDADLLVLDEPTAALDPLAELALFQRFVELVDGRTAIMISHRLGAARLADRILVLAQGRIIEEGSHDALIARGGEYARLFATQAQWYL